MPSTETIAAQDRTARALRQARGLYEQGRYLQAHGAAAPLGPLPAWPTLDGRILAAQLASQLGNPPLSLRLHLRLRRFHPESEQAWCWVVRAVRSRAGPFAAMELLRRGGPAAEPGPEALALRASTAGMLKDFLEADRLLDRAEALAPEDPWIRLERAHVLEGADDYAGALEATEEALRLRPHYRPAVELRADLLVLTGREEEALPLLRDAMARFESVGVAWSLLELQMERQDLPGAAATLDRIEQLSPLRTPSLVDQLARRRSDLAWLQGDRAAALRHARASRSPFHQRLAERLEAGREGPRTVLPVEFVRQHDRTCAPATLAALARFHGQEARHLEIAEAICYDGTPDWAQRRWAAEQGFRVREFTVDWGAARALLDRGLPFTLATVDPGNSHLQAVVGYDEGRDTLLLRDPTFRSLGELAEPGLAEYRASGPRGMALAPPGRAALLVGLPLPDAELHDHYHQVQAALVDHRREAAAAARAALQAAAPGHRLALQADRTLAGYDGDEEARLKATEALLQLYPDDVNLRLSKQASLGELGRRVAQVGYLREECARAGHPLLWLALAEALRLDARALPEVEALARRVARARPADAAAYQLLGHVRWERQEREPALHAYRAAACLGWAEERYAESYFRAARALGRTDEGLAFLRWRVERLGGLSGHPATTLYEALDAVERTAEAMGVLQEAVARRPDDGQLLLFAARARASTGALPEAEALLARARATAGRSELLRTEAWLAERAGELSRAAELWGALAELEPLDLGANRAAVRLLAETRGRPEALALLRRRVERFPFHQGLSRLLVGWLGGEAPAEVEAELRRLLAAHPGDAWAWRELAGVLSQQGRSAEALEALAGAEAIDPASSSLHNVRAAVHRDAGRLDEAKAELRRSLTCDADEDWALRRLLELSADAEERRGHLAFALEELRRQVCLGDGILGYQALAQGVRAPEALLADLREAHRRRPDLWHTWVALARQLAHAGAPGEARELLAEAAARFPLLARLPVEQAAVARVLGDRAAQRRALERAVALAPGWAEAAAELAELLQEAGDHAAERAVLERALRHAPGEALLRGWLADALRLSGDEPAAKAELERALKLDPGYAWAWQRLQRLCGDGEEAGRPRALAEAVVAERPRDSRAWVLLARARADLGGKLEALDRAVECWPRELAAWELRVDALADAGRFDEALAATRPAAYGGAPPRSLRLRAVRLEDARGERARAAEQLRTLLQAEPDDVEAWQLLADWEEEAGRAGGSLAAARELVRLAPHRAVSHGYLGQALLVSGARAEGKAALRRAVDLDPTYGWATQRLLGLEIEDGEAEAAARTLVLVERHVGQGEAGVGRVRLAVRLRDQAGALASLSALARCPDGWEGEEVRKAFEEAGWGAALDRLLVPLLSDPGASARAGALFAARAARCRRWLRGGRAISRALLGGEGRPAALGAAVEWLEQLAAARRRAAVRAFLRRHRARLEADPVAWGTGGYALCRNGQRRRAAAWLAGWRGRQGLRPWMLLNLAQSLRDLGRAAEAAPVNQAALALGADHTSPFHRIHLACDQVEGGPGAGEGADPLEGLELPERGYYRWLADLCLAHRATRAAGGGREAWRAARPHLAHSRVGPRAAAGEPYYRRLRRKVLWDLARRRAGPLAPLWFAAALARFGALVEW